MNELTLNVLSLRYSSWSMRAFLALQQTGAAHTIVTRALPHMQRQGEGDALAELDSTTRRERRELGSIHGLFPTLWIDGVGIHETLAICETLAEHYPDAGLWPEPPLERARARALSSEMATGFTGLRGELSCHLFGRVQGFTASAGAQADIERVFELWADALNRSGGPFLFGAFGIVDAMYFPVLTRFRTYGVTVPAALERYTSALAQAAPVQALLREAATAPPIPIYDDYLRELGGDPEAGRSDPLG